MRRAMRRIAREETSHAKLAWELRRWLHGRLDPAARRRVDEAHCDAVDALARDVARELDGSLAAELGCPRPVKRAPRSGRPPLDVARGLGLREDGS
jgi:hypothetical protein